MKVEHGRSVVVGRDLRHAGNSGDKFAQRPFNFDDHARVERRKPRNVATELDRIAISLIAVKQDRPVT